MHNMYHCAIIPGYNWLSQIEMGNKALKFPCFCGYISDHSSYFSKRTVSFFNIFFQSGGKKDGRILNASTKYSYNPKMDINTVLRANVSLHNVCGLLTCGLLA